MRKGRSAVWLLLIPFNSVAMRWKLAYPRLWNPTFCPPARPASNAHRSHSRCRWQCCHQRPLESRLSQIGSPCVWSRWRRMSGMHRRIRPRRICPDPIPVLVKPLGSLGDKGDQLVFLLVQFKVCLVCYFWLVWSESVSFPLTEQRDVVLDCSRLHSFRNNPPLGMLWGLPLLKFVMLIVPPLSISSFVGLES